MPQHVNKPHSKQCKAMTQERIDWIVIGKLLSRIPLVCSNKWNSLLTRNMRKGRYTAEEDALIRQRVEEWGDKRNGLWASLEKEMGRSGLAITRHWNDVLCRR